MKVYYANTGGVRYIIQANNIIDAKKILAQRTAIDWASEGYKNIDNYNIRELKENITRT